MESPASIPAENISRVKSCPIICANINVTSSFNQLLRDGRMTILGSGVERRCPIRFLRINIAARCEKQLRDISMEALNTGVDPSFA